MYKICDNLIERQLKKTKSDQRFILGLLIFALLFSIFIVVNTYVFFTVLVEGGSMRPTLNSGDVLIVNKYRQYQKGDIVVIDAGGGKLVVKRVIATERDTVEIINGVVKVNGNVIEENYIYEGYSDLRDDLSIMTIPKDHVFYLGDNRGNSLDSRMNGPCHENKILGVIEEWSLSLRPINKIFFNLGSYMRGGD